MKRFLITIVFLSVATLGFSQTAIGVKLNNPLATVSVITPKTANESYNIEYFGHSGVFNTGVFFRLPLKTHWVFLPEVMYKREAIPFRPEGSDLKLSDRHFIRFDCLEVPILLQIEGKKKFRGFGQIGVAPKFLLLASYSEKQYSEKYDITSHFNSVVMNLHLGGGVMWEFPKIILTVDGRFSTNLSPLTNQEPTPYLNFKDAQSYYFAISVGVGFKLAKNRPLQEQEPPVIAPQPESTAPVEAPTEEATEVREE
jgi:hypothetical protein